MKYYERVQLLEEWTEKLSELVELDMWCGLTEKFAPMKHVNGKRVAPDKNAEAVESIHWDLTSILERLTLLKEQAEQEAEVTESALEMFYAWEVGLCPSAVKGHPELRTFMYYGRVLEEIAAYRNENSLSCEDTERAIQEWLSRNRRTA